MDFQLSSPLQFYRTFKGLLDEHGIQYALTSGMACVEYGIQQNTKDTDWVIHPDCLTQLVGMLCEMEPGLSGRNWRISYRALFGAPLLPKYLAAGWTSHLAIHDAPNSPEHHLDFFGQPPRLTVEAVLERANKGIANLLDVAQMKKTDRDKDWPIVEALSQQAAFRNDVGAILQTRDPNLMSNLWSRIAEKERAELLVRRPLLSELDEYKHGLKRCLAAERAIWEEVNRLRYRSFQSAWKDFLRSWRKEDDFAWPVSLPFAEQHHLVCHAAEVHRLPLDPLGGQVGRTKLIDLAAAAVADIFHPAESLITAIMPPVQEMLP